MNTFNPVDSSDITLDGALLIHGTYSKQGNDLTIHTDTESVLIKDFFVHTPNLVSVKGSKITPHLATLLSAPNYQSEFLAFEDPQAIGEITIADGSIMVTRSGQQIELNIGDYIYLNDLVETGTSTIGITFKDDTALSLETGARMVIDDFVYDPQNPTEGSMNANVLGGGFSFVSGNIAKTGADAMTVTTPVLTIGVRGTQVAGRANQDGEENEIVLLPNDDGTVGQILVSNESGSVLLTEAFQGTTIVSAVAPPTIPVIVPEDVVLEKFAKTIATTKTTLKTSDTKRKSKEAEEKKQEVEEKKQEAEQKKQEAQEEKQQLEEQIENADSEEERVELEQQLEQVEEDIQEVDQEIQQVEQEVQEVEQEINNIKQDFDNFKNDMKDQFGDVFEQIEAVVDRAFVEDPFQNAPINQDEMERQFEEEMQQIEQEFQQDQQEGRQLEGAPEEVQDIFENAENFEDFQQQMDEMFRNPEFQEQMEQEMQQMDQQMEQEMQQWEQEMLQMEQQMEQEMQQWEQEMKKQEEEFAAFMDDGFFKEEDYQFEERIFLDPDDFYLRPQDQQDDFFYFQPLVLNSSPTIDRIDNLSESESLSVGSTITTVSATDPDGDRLVYSLDYDATGKLSIDQNGVITLVEAFDNVTEDTEYQVFVKVDDGNGGLDIKDFYITVTADAEVVVNNNSDNNSGSNDPADWVTAGDGSAGDYAQTIGYVGMNSGSVSTVITELGHTAVDFVPGSTDIDTLNVLWYLNPSNDNWQENVGDYQTEIFDWVDSGGVFVIHDRYVSGANDFLLGETATITREFNDSADYDIIDESSTNLLREGPGGTLVDGKTFSNGVVSGEFGLDGGTSTSHGSADLTTFDNELALATKTDTNSVIDFVYEYGSGAVYYSTVPLDFYISSYETGKAYAKNSLHYATSLIFDGYSELKGTASDDDIYGSGGDDVIWGGGGRDTLWGGGGADVFDYDAISDSNTTVGYYDNILDFNASEDSINVSDITNSVTKVLYGSQLQLDTDGDSTADMFIDLTGYTGTVDDITVVT